MGLFDSIFNPVFNPIFKPSPPTRLPAPIPKPVEDWLEEKKDQAKEKAKEWAQEKIDDGLDWIEDKLGMSNTLDNQSSASQVYEINELLLEYNDGYRRFARTTEDKVLSLIREHFEQMMSLLSSTVELKREFRQELETLRRKQQSLCDTIPDSISDAVAKRVSIDDLECRYILALSGSDDKRRKLQTFCKKVIREANNDLAQRINAELIEQCNDLAVALDEYIKTKEQNFKHIRSTFDQIENDLVKETNKRSDKCAFPMVFMHITERVDQLLFE